MRVTAINDESKVKAKEAKETRRGKEKRKEKRWLLELHV